MVQRTYGRQGSDLPAIMRVFLSDLVNYPMQEIVEAIHDWRKTSPEFPTPADIIKILNPKPTFDKAVYLQLVKRKERGELNEYGAEFAYIKRYERAVLNGDI